MDINSALIDAVEQAGWSPVMVAAIAGVSEAGARKWLNGLATPNGESLIILMRELPGLSERLGFAPKAA